MGENVAITLYLNVPTIVYSICLTALLYAHRWFLGMPGPTGAPGPEGAQGQSGEAGNKGEQGDKGVTGTRGLPGSQGKTVKICLVRYACTSTYDTY